jgi:hypothetical protein
LTLKVLEVLEVKEVKRMGKEWWSAPVKDVDEPEVLPRGIAVPADASPADFLRAVYTDPGVPLPLRIRAAVECAPYFHPKLAATFAFGPRLGRDLEEAIARSEGRPGVTPPQPSEGDQ